MTDMVELLDVCCRVAGCSVLQARGKRRVGKFVKARMLFYVLALERGCRQYEVMWFLGREAQVGYHYRVSVKRQLRGSAEFRKMVEKARAKYEAEQ